MVKVALCSRRFMGFFLPGREPPSHTIFIRALCTALQRLTLSSSGGDLMSQFGRELRPADLDALYR